MIQILIHTKKPPIWAWFSTIYGSMNPRPVAPVLSAHVLDHGHSLSFRDLLGASGCFRHPSYTTMENPNIFNGKTHYLHCILWKTWKSSLSLWPCSVAMLNVQRVPSSQNCTILSQVELLKLRSSTLLFSLASYLCWPENLDRPIRSVHHTAAFNPRNCHDFFTHHLEASHQNVNNLSRHLDKVSMSHC